MNEEDKISHLMKGIAEELYQALLPRDVHNTEQFITECRRIESLHCKRVTPTKYKRLPNVASLSDHDDRADLSSMIRQIVREGTAGIRLYSRGTKNFYHRRYGFFFFLLIPSTRGTGHDNHGRWPVRGQITKLINGVETVLKKPVEELDKTDLRVSALQLEDLCRDLHEWDEKVTEAMLDEEVTEAEQEKEYDERLKYDRLIKRMREELEKVLNPKKGVSPQPDETSSDTSNSTTRRRVLLPKRKLPEFRGDVREWITFWSRFEDIHNDKDLSLQISHRSRQCKKKVRCDFCKRDGHYAIMCRGADHAETEIKSPQRPQNSTPTPGSSDVATVNEMSNCVSTKACLETLLVKVWGPKGSKVVRAVIDSGSSQSYILEHIVKDLGVPIIWEKKSLIMKYLVGSARCIRKPTFGSWARELASKKIQLSAFKAESDVVELLLGADINPKIATANMIRLSDDLIAQETLLGWVVQSKTEGKFPDKNPNQVHNSMLIISLMTQEIKVSDLWSLENIGVMDDRQADSKEETNQAIMDKFRTEKKQLESGRYEVHLPWIESAQKLKEDKSQAEKRLRKMTEDLKKRGFYHHYNNIFEEWEENGIIQRIQSDKDDTLEYFLPHRAVVKSGSSTTPVRPVFDDSCKTKGGWSLNNCLAKGPNLLELIPDIMLRFRLNKIGVIADIEKAFLQISVGKEDRQFFRFLWWEDGKQENLRIYQHKRVVFGVTSSPFLLAATLKLHLKQYEREVIPLLKSMYMDNCVNSVTSLEEAQESIAMPETNIWFWTDSSTALRWIQIEKPWATFVRNRVNEICSISKKENWHHVSGVNNPADLPSRGSSVKKLIEHKWWEGPSFLWSEEPSWNQFDPIFDEEEINKSIKEGDVVLMEVDNKKRTEWPIGVIEKTYPGKDGIVRVAMIKTKRGHFLRPVQRLFFLESSENHSKEDFRKRRDLEKEKINLDTPKKCLFEDTPKNSSPLYSELEYRIEPASIQLIEVASRDIPNDAIVMAELLLERELTAPSSVISLTSNRGKLWVMNRSPYPKLIPQGMHVADSVIIEDDQLCTRADCNQVETEVKHSEDPKISDFLIDDSLDESQKDKLRYLLNNYTDIFEFSKRRQFKDVNVKHRINTGDHLPTKQRPYRVAPRECQIIQDEPQKDRNLNIRNPRKFKIRDTFLTHLVRGARFYSSMDLQSGYWQIVVEESDREKTAFITPDGLYEFKVMPFGLCNAPATFERMMDNLLKGLKWTTCLCYLDDIIVFSDNFEEHLRGLQNVLSCLKQAGLCLNAKKCKFGAKTITVLGHEVSGDGIRPDPEKIRAVRDFPTPKSLKEVRSFLGLSSYYRRFIPNYSQLAQPLNELLKKDSIFCWSLEEQREFDALKSAIISEPVLGHFDYSSPTEIHTDTSSYGIGAVL
ncbi:hypothetical protein LAZ67_8001196, partial [Cordylochernes scorpioides]